MNIYNKYLVKILLTITELIEENNWQLKNKCSLNKIVLEQPKNITFGEKLIRNILAQQQVNDLLGYLHKVGNLYSKVKSMKDQNHANDE